jgi:sugar lactone lactonase YvrE
MPRKFPFVVLTLGLTAAGCARNETLTFEASEEALTLNKPALYPETIEYDGRSGRFLLGSFREGAIYQLDGRGNLSRLVNDDRLCSVLGIALDVARDRVWAVSANLGASIKQCSDGPKKLAGVGIYRLSTGEALGYVDLAPLLEGEHLLNGIAIDPTGNAYVTDSFSPAIFKIDLQGKPSVFLRDDRFLGEGINLNGVVVHPDGYLLVVKKSDGTLFKVDLADPSRVAKVEIAERLIGGDGLTLVGKKELVVIANEALGVASNAAFSVSSEDGWGTARVRAVKPLGAVYPTTGVLRDGKMYVVSSRLNALIQSAPEQRERLHEEATIRQIGKVAR